MLNPLGVKLVSDVNGRKPWDTLFRQWVHQAKLTGSDPNDVGDTEWSDDHLMHALRERYLKHITADSVVLELGPGTGRLTRHLIGHCKTLICVDYSQMVCDWLRDHFRTERCLAVHHITTPSLPIIADSSIDVIVAHGVFEHINLPDLSFFLEDCYRTLQPSGVMSFNYDNIMTRAGFEWLKEFRGKPGDQCIFHFYHPHTMAWIAENAGFSVLQNSVAKGRLCHIELQKPPRYCHVA
jgi:ubiquinone/menaquinone biosynthesis C-methylase UbiE